MAAVSVLCRLGAVRELGCEGRPPKLFLARLIGNAVSGEDPNLCYQRLVFSCVIHFLCLGRPHFFLGQVHCFPPRLGKKRCLWFPEVHLLHEVCAQPWHGVSHRGTWGSGEDLRGPETAFPLSTLHLLPIGYWVEPRHSRMLWVACGMFLRLLCQKLWAPQSGAARR